MTSTRPDVQERVNHAADVALRNGFDSRHRLHVDLRERPRTTRHTANTRPIVAPLAAAGPLIPPDILTDIGGSAVGGNAWLLAIVLIVAVFVGALAGGAQHDAHPDNDADPAGWDNGRAKILEESRD